MGEDVLDEVVAILITRNVDQGNAWTIKATLANAIKVATEEFRTTNLEALFNDLRSKLIHAVLRSVTDDVVNGAATISWSTMLADVLNAPVTELSVSNNIDSCQYFLNTRTL